MLVVRRCPNCGQVVADVGNRCTQCGRDDGDGERWPAGGRLVTFDHAARLQHAASESRARGHDGGPDAPQPVGAAVETRGGPSGTPATIDEEFTPRIWLMVLGAVVPVAVGMTFWREATDRTSDMVFQVVCRAIAVTVQFAVVRRVSRERGFALVLALLMAASLAPAQPTVRHQRLFTINLVLMLLGLQAVAIAAVRLWQQAGPDTNADPHAETPRQPSLDAQTTADGFDAGIPDGPQKGGRHADDAV